MIGYPDHPGRGVSRAAVNKGWGWFDWLYDSDSDSDSDDYKDLEEEGSASENRERMIKKADELRRRRLEQLGEDPNLSFQELTDRWIANQTDRFFGNPDVFGVDQIPDEAFRKPDSPPPLPPRDNVEVVEEEEEDVEEPPPLPPRDNVEEAPPPLPPRPAVNHVNTSGSGGIRKIRDGRTVRGGGRGGGRVWRPPRKSKEEVDSDSDDSGEKASQQEHNIVLNGSGGISTRCRGGKKAKGGIALSTIAGALPTLLKIPKKIYTHIVDNYTSTGQMRQRERRNKQYQKMKRRLKY